METGKKNTNSDLSKTKELRRSDYPSSDEKSAYPILGKNDKKPDSSVLGKTDEKQRSSVLGKTDEKPAHESENLPTFAYYCGTCGYRFENQTDKYCPICGQRREVLM